MTLSPPARPWLGWYAKLTVLAVFVLIFLGGLVTSWGAGMAVPDWPLSFGSLNPAGWWANGDVRLEHGHRLFASLVGLLTMLLCSWVWRNRGLMWSAGILGLGLLYSFVRPVQHAQRNPEQMMHVGLIMAGIVFAVVAVYSIVLFTTSRAAENGERTLRWLAFAAFVGVCLQATLGGLRVTGQTAGDLQLALALRIFHGCVAQAYLVCMVAIATLLSPTWVKSDEAATSTGPRLIRGTWIVVSALFFQLIAGAIMRHLGAGLAIQTFPEASPSGSYLPAQHNGPTDINFLHTRIGAGVVTVLILVVAIRVWRAARGDARLVWPAVTLLALVAVQFSLGVLVILHQKPPTLTTFHVLNGAALLATAVLLALRVQRFTVSSDALQTPNLSHLPKPSLA